MKQLLWSLKKQIKVIDTGESMQNHCVHYLGHESEKGPIEAHNQPKYIYVAHNSPAKTLKMLYRFVDL